MATPNQRGANDDPREADESGEPGETGRSHGRIVDADDPQGQLRTAPDEAAKSGKKDVATNAEHWESGRQRSN